MDNVSRKNNFNNSNNSLKKNSNNKTRNNSNNNTTRNNSNNNNTTRNNSNNKTTRNNSNNKTTRNNSNNNKNNNNNNKNNNNKNNNNNLSDNNLDKLFNNNNKKNNNNNSSNDVVRNNNKNNINNKNNVSNNNLDKLFNNNKNNNNSNNDVIGNNNKKDTIDTIKKTISNKASNVADTYDNIKNTVSSKMNNVQERVEDMTGSSVGWTIIKILILVIVIIIILHIIKYYYTEYSLSYVESPYLLETTKNGKHALVISQDPDSESSIMIKRSVDKDGIEFSYQFWMVIDDYTYKKGEWKHIFHKGNSSSYPSRAPGVVLHPDTNSMRVYMNTVDRILEYVDVDNLPLKKWMHIAIVLKNKDLDVYVNGFLKVRKELSSIPKQNDYDLWVNMFGGFEGYLSKLRYHNYAITFDEVDNAIKNGPSSSACIDSGEEPPYLDNRWWFE